VRGTATGFAAAALLGFFVIPPSAAATLLLSMEVVLISGAAFTVEGGTGSLDDFGGVTGAIV
jgi:hypothetical protein